MLFKILIIAIIIQILCFGQIISMSVAFDFEEELVLGHFESENEQELPLPLSIEEDVTLTFESKNIITDQPLHLIKTMAFGYLDFRFSQPDFQVEVGPPKT